MPVLLPAPAGGRAARPASPASPAWERALYLALVAGFAVVVYLNVHGALFDPVLHAAERHHWARLLVFPSVLWALMGCALIAFRTVVWARYRPFTSASPDEAPRLSVVIPAFNEGPMVLQAIESVAAARYPADRLEIFVIDDGSRDDTWTHIEEAARRHPRVVQPIRFQRNQGKRAALAAGFARATGEVLVTLDSDSVIDPDTLLALAGPFRDPRVGAVAGKVAVYNRTAGVIPRMLHVRYVLSFDVLRAAESSYGNVFCCPGALTAYRASAVRRVLDRWLEQRFLGVRCTFGEDRALTNFLLGERFDTVYQQAAIVHTVVPTSYAKLCRMFLRWDRSYVREEIRFLRIVWKRPPRARFIALFDRLITNLRYPVNYASIVLLAMAIADRPETIVRFLLAIGLMSAFYTLYYLRSERSLDFAYGILYAYFSFFTLFWIMPWAAVTVRARSWMTR